MKPLIILFLQIPLHQENSWIPQERRSIFPFKYSQVAFENKLKAYI